MLDDSGAVAIGGEIVGKLEGFRFAADPRAEGIHGRTLRAAALKGLEGEFVARARTGLRESDDDGDHAQRTWALWWDGAIVGATRAGTAAPCSRLLRCSPTNICRGELRERLQAGSTAGCRDRIGERLEPLLALRAPPMRSPARRDALPAEARGIAHQLCEALGSLDRTRATLPPDRTRRDARAAARSA